MDPCLPRGVESARLECCGVLGTAIVSGECARVVARHSSTGLSCPRRDDVACGRAGVAGVVGCRSAGVADGGWRFWVTDDKDEVARMEAWEAWKHGSRNGKEIKRTARDLGGQYGGILVTITTAPEP
jgi:hypothetical protein